MSYKHKLTMYMKTLCFLFEIRGKAAIFFCQLSPPLKREPLCAAISATCLFCIIAAEMSPVYIVKKSTVRELPTCSTTPSLVQCYRSSYQIFQVPFISSLNTDTSAHCTHLCCLSFELHTTAVHQIVKFISFSYRAN